VLTDTPEAHAQKDSLRALGDIDVNLLLFVINVHQTIKKKRKSITGLD